MAATSLLLFAVGFRLGSQPATPPSRHILHSLLPFQRGQPKSSLPAEDADVSTPTQRLVTMLEDLAQETTDPMEDLMNHKVRLWRYVRPDPRGHALTEWAAVGCNRTEAAIWLADAQGGVALP